MRRVIALLILPLTLCSALGGNRGYEKGKGWTDSIHNRQLENIGSTDMVTEDRMNKGLVTNSLDALSGQAAGVTVSNGENRMAMLSSVRVRAWYYVPDRRQRPVGSH